jgi:hypothetical protein
MNTYNALMISLTPAWPSRSFLLPSYGTHVDKYHDMKSPNLQQVKALRPAFAEKGADGAQTAPYQISPAASVVNN